MTLVEVCVDTLGSALLAEAGGADRVELCADLSDGGTTPSHAAIALTQKRLRIPVFPIVRLRGGGFVYDADELLVMRTDLQQIRMLEAPGAVIGALNIDGTIDRDAVARLRDDAGTMQLTFHRAFDVAPDPFAALETLVALGVDRVLTSGQAQTAWDGRHLIAQLVIAAANRIVVMAGGAVTEDQARDLVAETGVREVHVRCATLRRDDGREPGFTLRKAPPRDEMARGVTDSQRVRLVREMLDE